MKLLDSNIIIYSSQEEYSSLRTLFNDDTVHVSAITKVEVLGFRNLMPTDKLYFEAVFRQVLSIPVTDAVIDKATLLRQKHRLSIGDAIIAATAFVHKCTLYTRNVSDFSKINGITVHNPIEQI
jgi:hypothetical protein